MSENPDFLRDTAEAMRRRAVMTDLLVGLSLESVAEDHDIEVAVVEQWLRDAQFVAEMNGLRAQLANSFAAHGAQIVSAALEALENRVADDPKLAVQLVIASRVLERGGAAQGAPDPQELTIIALERASRIRWLKKLDELGLSEEEWFATLGAMQPKRGRRKY